MADEDLQAPDYFSHLEVPDEPDADAWAELEPDATDFETPDAAGAETGSAVVESVESSLAQEPPAE